MRVTVCLAMVFGLIGAASLAAGALPSHLDKSKNHGGCSGCHAGHGKRGTPMLRGSNQEFCYNCHGLGAKTDIYSVFNKRSKHPVSTTYAYHSPLEKLPETSRAMPRHVACQDCHNVHEAEPEKPFKRVPGYSRERMKKNEATEEYELCYKCHSDSLNLPLGSKNKREEFSISNASFHPIEVSGRNKRVPSLIQPLNVSSRINCSDCHGNDDSFGPRGPHGSNFDFMLKGEYVMSETVETPQMYELCYTCHERRSILSNESFQKHKEHIVYYHAPCSACHTSHGTNINPHLIEFNAKFVRTSPMPSYLPGGYGRPVCFLKCHIGGRDVLHDNAFYAGKKWP